MSYWVYVLLSGKDKRTYVGYAQSAEARLGEHNAGKVTATKHRRPLTLVFKEAFSDEAAAKIREQSWKSGAGRRKLKNYFIRGFPPISDGRGSPK